jgi:hypothetical protein
MNIWVKIGAFKRGKPSKFGTRTTAVHTFILWIKEYGVRVYQSGRKWYRNRGCEAHKGNPYRIPHAKKPVTDEHIGDMLRRKIEPSISRWSSSITLVQKKSKDGSIMYRFCIDYRALIAVTKPHAYPIANIVDTSDSRWQSKIFSVLDMASGCHQIPIKTEHRENSAFSYHRGHFQFLNMLFGLNNAPANY